MSKCHFAKVLAAVFCATFFAAVASIPANAQTFTVIQNFTGGSQPSFPASLKPVIGRDGNVYSESLLGGTLGAGTVFNATPSGTITVLHNKESGCSPRWLSAGSDGNIYGACAGTSGSPNGYIWSMTTSGTFTDLHDFNGSTEGSQPVAAVLATDGNLYGVNLAGGTNNLGTFYQYSPSKKTVTVLYTFANDALNGYDPLCIPAQASSGLTFYCTTQNGGTSGQGTAFSITSKGVFKLLHTFAGGTSDGADPDSGVILGTDGNLYGVTRTGGTSNFGTVFKLTTAGTVTILHSFNGGSDGGYPANGLNQASDGNLYGTANDCTSSCGSNQTAFKVTTGGTFTVLHTFNLGTDGNLPDGGIVQLNNGEFYGVCEQGGTTGSGTLWTISTGLKAFLTLGSTSGNVGSAVGIQGQGFTSSSVVKFNGVQATTVTLTDSAYLTATVPTGATNGFVTVTTGSTTLTSTQKYTVHNSWGSGTVMPTAAEAAGAGFISPKIYVVGGSSGSAVLSNTQIYNTSTNAWTTGTAIPTPVSAPATAVVSGVLYVFGGYTNASGTTVTNHMENAVADSAIHNLPGNGSGQRPALLFRWIERGSWHGDDLQPRADLPAINGK